MILLAPWLLAAQPAVNEQEAWPRVRSTNGNTVTLYEPQVEDWNINWFKARAVVEVQPAGSKKTQMGIVWFDAFGSVDHSNRIVTLDRVQITKGRFPAETEYNSSNALALVRELFPGGARTVSLDYLITALGFMQAEARQETKQELGHTPPDIIWSTNPAVLVIIDGEPVFRPISNSTLERVINTPALMVRDRVDNKFYLSGGGQWFSADSVTDQWSLAQMVPPEVASLAPPPTNAPVGAGAPASPGTVPSIIVSFKPAELLMTAGTPDFRPIRGTSLQYAAHSDSQLFFDTKERAAYLLISGRWYTATSLQGPWSYVSPEDLPDDFAKIPPNSPQGIVLASVPGTPQAELATVANSMPTTATVNRHDAKLDVKYDGEPQFKPIEGTSMSYAINAQLPVINLGTNYFAVQDAVWFVANSPTGQWQVATEVPEEIYTIPPTSPVYYTTFARIYDYDTNTVEEGYTPGYTGAYDDDGTMVYGTGYDYQPYYGNDYYGWGWTYGYGYWYVPWYGSWVWRPWWNSGNGWRAASIDNIYDRWHGPGVTPHDRAVGSAANRSALQNYSGYPALYGRFQGPAGRTQFSPPANTLALNPYSRPQMARHTGEIPRGSQLLTTMQQSPGAGRDLYAGTDGNIYMRRNNGWYREGARGNWDFYAPAQGQMERGLYTHGQAVANGGGEYRIANSPNAVGAMGQVFGTGRSGGPAPAQISAGLDQQYYARQLGKARAQNWSPPVQTVRGVQGARGGNIRGIRGR